MGRGPRALIVDHPVELEGEDAGLIGRRPTVRHADFLRSLRLIASCG